MNAERLLEHYERIADASDAITRLRRVILDLAVRSKLVSQDPRDEPASVLLKRIAAEKARLVEDGGVRKPKALSSLDLDDLPFPLPMGWAWTQIGELGVVSPRIHAPDDQPASFVPMPMIAAEYGVTNEHEPRPWGEIKKGYTHFAEGDVGLAKITPCFENGKSTVFRNLTGGIGSGTTELHIVRPLFVSPDYIVLVIKSPYFIENGIPRMTGTAGQKRVPAEYFTSSPFPLPPLAEQHRIVAKVDELMALCDRLEAARAERETTRDRLTASSLARLNAPDPETFQDDARFVLNTLPALTTRPDQIKQLRHTILNLAVRGKLVPQDPYDEPPHKEIERYQQHKFTSMSGGGRKKLEGLSLASNDHYPYYLPQSWTWASTEQLCEAIVDCPHSTPKFVRQGIICLDTNSIKSSGLIQEKIRFVSEESYAERIKRLEPQPGDIVFAREGSVGESIVIPVGMKCCLGQRVMLFRPYPITLPRYFQLALSELQSLERLMVLHKGIGARHVNVGDMRKALIPVPPVAEQDRIVDKVDELMVLCDKLEAGLTDQATIRRQLLEAFLHEALSIAA